MRKAASWYWVILLLSYCILEISPLSAQEKWFEVPLSERIASYDIDVKLDVVQHKLNAPFHFIYI